MIALVLLIAVGPEQLPAVIRRAGRAAAQARSMTESLRSEFMSGLDDIERAADPNAWAASASPSKIQNRPAASLNKHIVTADEESDDTAADEESDDTAADDEELADTAADDDVEPAVSDGDSADDHVDAEPGGSGQPTGSAGPVGNGAVGADPIEVGTGAPSEEPAAGGNTAGNGSASAPAVDHGEGGNPDDGEPELEESR